MKPTDADAKNLHEWILRMCHIPRDKFSIGIGADRLHVYTQASARSLRDFTPRWNGCEVEWHFRCGPTVAQSA